MNEPPRSGIIERALRRAARFAAMAAGAIGRWRGQRGTSARGRWTEGMQRIHLRAQEEAARLGTDSVGPEQYLLALAADSDCAGARVLEQLGISLCTVRQQLLQQVRPGPGAHRREMRLSPRGKRVIGLAKDEARHLDERYVGTEHLLLGLIREGESLAARVLVKLGADPGHVRRLVWMMGQRMKRPSP